MASVNDHIGRILGRELPPDENFFDAGMNSITVLRLHTALSAALDTRITVTDLFTHTSVRALADFLAERANHRRSDRSGRHGGQDRFGVAADSRRRIRHELYHDLGTS